MSCAKLFVMALVGMVFAARGASGQGGTANIEIPLPIQIQDMMTMKRVKVRITTQEGHALFNMVWAKAHGGSVPAEPWDFLTSQGGGAYQAFVNMPMSGPFYVIGKVEWENPNTPGFPFSPSDIDYPTRGPFQQAFMKVWSTKQKEEYTNKVLADSSSAKLEVEVKNKKVAVVKFHQGFEKKLRVLVGFLKDNDEIAENELELLKENTDPAPHEHVEIATESGQYWAHGYVKFGEEPNEYLLISKGPINVKIE